MIQRDRMTCPTCGGIIEFDMSTECGSCDTCSIKMEYGKITEEQSSFKLLDKPFGCTIQHSDGIAFLQDGDGIYLVYMGENYSGHSGNIYGVSYLVPDAYLGHCTWASEGDIIKKFDIKEDLLPIVRSDINEV